MPTLPVSLLPTGSAPGIPAARAPLPPWICWAWWLRWIGMDSGPSKGRREGGGRRGEEKEEEDTDNSKSNDLHLTGCTKKNCKRKQPGNSLNKVNKHFVIVFQWNAQCCRVLEVTYSHLPWNHDHTTSLALMDSTASRDHPWRNLEGNNRTCQVLIQKITFCKFPRKLDCLWFGIPLPTIPAEPRNIHSCVPHASGHSCTISTRQENAGNQ